MDRDSGNLNSPIWIIGDSEPDRWKDVLKVPFDPRHPIRHNIITSIFDNVQDHIFRSTRKRIDTSIVYIRNAVDQASLKPRNNQLVWSDQLSNEIRILNNLITMHNPLLIFTFGAFAYEFTCRSMNCNQNKYSYWTTKRLGDEFRRNLSTSLQSNPIIIPLLHRSIAGGHFIKSHENFCGVEDANYFEYVGKELAEIIIKYLNNSDIWIN